MSGPEQKRGADKPVDIMASVRSFVPDKIGVDPRDLEYVRAVERASVELGEEWITARETAYFTRGKQVGTTAHNLGRLHRLGVLDRVRMPGAACWFYQAKHR